MERVELKPKVCLTIQVKDKQGNILKEITKENDPLTRWGLRSLYTFLVPMHHTVKDETGTSRTYRWDRTEKRWGHKIAIGLDSTTPTFDDFKLGAKERETVAITITPLNEIDTTAEFEIRYDFLIEKDITYYEFGLFGQGRDDGTIYHFLVSRDVITAGVPVPKDSYLTIIYRIILGTV